MIGRVFQCIHRTSPVDIAPLEQAPPVQVTVCVGACVCVCVCVCMCECVRVCEVCGLSYWYYLVRHIGNGCHGSILMHLKLLLIQVM